MVGVSDGVEAVSNCGDRVGVLVEHAVNSGQHARLCVPLSLSPNWNKLVFKDPIIIVFAEKLEFENKIALWESCKKLGSPELGHPLAISMSPMSSGSSSSTLQGEKTAEAPSTSHSSLASLRITTHWSAGSLTGGGGGALVIEVGKLLTLWDWVGEFCKNFFDQVVHSGDGYMQPIKNL